MTLCCGSFVILFFVLVLALIWSTNVDERKYQNDIHKKHVVSQILIPWAKPRIHRFNVEQLTKNKPYKLTEKEQKLLFLEQNKSLFTKSELKELKKEIDFHIKHKS